MFFTPDGRGRYRWVSSPTARHSRNIAARPEVALVIFDSTVPVGGAEALYASALAGLVPDAEIEPTAAAFNVRLDPSARIAAHQLRAPGPLRLYEAVASQHWVLLRGGDPRNSTGIDRRVEVRLPGDPR